MKEKMIKRKLLSFLLTLALVLGLVPWMSLTAYAEPEATTLGEDTLYVAGVDITTAQDGIIDSSNATGVTGTATLTYEEGIPVLTLSNFNYSGTGETVSDSPLFEYSNKKVYAGICYLGKAKLVIRLSGTNVIGINNKELNPGSAYGIYSPYGDGIVEIESDDNGSLSVTSKDAYQSASNRTPIWVGGTLVMKSGTILTNSNTENPVNSGIARGMCIEGKLNFYGGTIKSTGSPKMTSIRYDGIAFFIEKLDVQQGITPVVKCGETESGATEMVNPIASNAFKYDNANNTYHYASISAADYREPVSFIYKPGAALMTCSLYNIVTSNTTEWSSGWYVVNKDTTISQQKTSSDGVVNISSKAEVNLILCDGVKLTITDTDMNSNSAHPGIKLPVDATLNIFGQGATNPGELNVSYGGDGKSRQFYQINGGGYDKGGNIVVNGGKLTANGGSHILNLTSLTVNDGIVNAINGTTYAINSSTITITKGEINGSATSNPSAISGNIFANGGRLVGINKSNEYGGIGGTITLGTGMYLYGGEDETSAVHMDANNKAKYMRIDNTPPYKALDMTGDTTPVTIQRGGSALSGAPVVDDVLTVVCPATDLVYEWFVGVFFASPFCRKLQNKNVGCCKTVL